MAVLQTRGLGKRYKTVDALSGVDLDVQEGEVFGLLGVNGAGKTTFTRCVAGFVRPTSGTIHVAGIDAVGDPVSARRHIGLVPDVYGFYPNLTGREHLRFYARLQGVPGTEREQRITDLIEQMHMTEHADRRTGAYSHGMKQRICIAQALVHRPRLVMFDEPTNGLDPKGAYELRQLIRSLSDGRTTVILNSHIMSEVEQTCDRVAILERGRIKLVDDVSALRERASGGRVVMRVAKATKKGAEAITKAAGTEVTVSDDGYGFVGDDDTVPVAINAAVASGVKILAVERPEASLESAFLSLLEGEE